LAQLLGIAGVVQESSNAAYKEVIMQLIIDGYGSYIHRKENLFEVETKYQEVLLIFINHIAKIRSAAF
jgi:hypothetical protein